MNLRSLHVNIKNPLHLHQLTISKPNPKLLRSFSSCYISYSFFYIIWHFLFNKQINNIFIWFNNTLVHKSTKINLIFSIICLTKFNELKDHNYFIWKETKPSYSYFYYSISLKKLFNILLNLVQNKIIKIINILIIKKQLSICFI